MTRPRIRMRHIVLAEATCPEPGRASRSRRAFVTAGVLIVALCGCGSSAAAKGNSARAGASARQPGLSADCLTDAPRCYPPQVLRTAYGIQPLLERGIDGRGVTVVLPETAETGPTQHPAVTDIRQDMADFDSRFGLSRAHIQVITTLAGPSASPWLARLEEIQDTELVHAVAPDATIDELLVDPADLSTPAKAAAEFTTLVRIASRRAHVISLSISFGEHFFTGTEVTAIHTALEYAAAHHVTVVASSGDDGVLGKGSITPPVKEVSLPASDPLVLAVGGTSLNVNPVSGSYIGETAWNTPLEGAGDSAASGGGFSHLFTRPAYQSGLPGASTMRGVPDVAADASPFTGMAVARSAPYGTYMLTGAGGTSSSAPFWGGIIALADQQAGHPLGFINATIYRIARSPQYQKAFHDIVTGNNAMILTSTSGPVTVSGYQAGPGWDPVTVLGTPDALVLVPLLAR
jgi:subtilase family serine protease